MVEHEQGRYRIFQNLARDVQLVNQPVAEAGLTRISCREVQVCQAQGVAHKPSEPEAIAGQRQGRNVELDRDTSRRHLHIATQTAYQLQRKSLSAVAWSLDNHGTNGIVWIE